MSMNKPDTAILAPGLASILNHGNVVLSEIVERRPSGHGGTFPAEIVTCRLSNNQLITVRLKYSHGLDQLNNRFGLRAGTQYEKMIYEEVLQDLPLTTPRFYGTCHFPNDQSCFAIEYLESAKQLMQVDARFFGQAAQWIATFHSHFVNQSPLGVRKYDHSYYLFWVNPIESMAVQLKIGWMLGLCDWYRQHIPDLVQGEQTLIHGEFYGKNILIQGMDIYPVDWETAALAAGEVDLAALMDGKDEERGSLALQHYTSTRWPDGPPADFTTRLTVAQLYFKFRWMAEWVNDSATLEKWLRRGKFAEKIKELASLAGIRVPSPLEVS